jgi:uncharacterized membrane protein YdjX (TVP38/TMEM64 family)
MEKNKKEIEKKSKKEKKGLWFLSLWLLIFILFLFLFSSFVIDRYLPFFAKYFSSQWGILVFIIALILEVVFAPVSAIPFIPIVTSLYGWVSSGFATLIGWSIGSLIAFFIGRRYGINVLEKSNTLKKIHSMEKIIPRHHMFFGTILLRLALPIDILSYGLGIFTKMDWRVYFLASMLGYAPISFLLAYMGAIDFRIQAVLLLFSFTLIMGIVFLIYKDQKVKEKLIEKWNKEFE